MIFIRARMRAYVPGHYVTRVYMLDGRLYLLVGGKKHHSTKDKVLDMVNTKICNNQVIMLISSHRVILYV
jgi:hypothetical protein